MTEPDRCPCPHPSEDHSVRGCRKCACDWRQHRTDFERWVFWQAPPKLFGRDMQLHFRSTGLGARNTQWVLRCGGVVAVISEWDDQVTSESRANDIARCERLFVQAHAELTELIGGSK